MRSPSLPNRTGGSPASGFPVRGSRWAGLGSRGEALRGPLPAAQAFASLTRCSRAAHWSPTPCTPAILHRADAQSLAALRRIF